MKLKDMNPIHAVRKARSNPFTSPAMAVAATAALGFGFSMPSCPGQQAMQQQIDALQAKANEDAGRIDALSTQVATLNKSVSDLQAQLGSMGPTVIAQKEELESLRESLKEVQPRLPSAKGARRR